MIITEVRINKFDNNGLKAFATITLDKCFVVSGLQVREGQHGLFVSMPNAKGKDGNYHDTSYPITKEFREEISKEVLQAYNSVNKAE